MGRSYPNFYYDQCIKAFMSYSACIILIEKKFLTQIDPPLFKTIRQLYRHNFYRHINDIYITCFNDLPPYWWIKIDRSVFPKSELQSIFNIEHKDLDVYVDNKSKRVLFISPNYIFYMAYNREPDDVISLLENYIK